MDWKELHAGTIFNPEEPACEVRVKELRLVQADGQTRFDKKKMCETVLSTTGSEEKPQECYVCFK